MSMVSDKRLETGAAAPAWHVLEPIVARASAHPEAPAVTWNDRTWTYRQLLLDVEGAAAQLLEAGLAPGVPLAVFAGNHPAVVISWMACARSGIVASVINHMLKGPELAWILAHLQPRWVLTDDARADIVRAALVESGVHADVALIGDGTFPVLDGTHADEGSPIRWPTEDALLEVTYTSGTTGHPKGAAFRNGAHRYQCSALSAHLGLSPSTVTYVVVPLFHASGLRNSVLTTLYAGGEAVLGDRFSVSNFWDECQRYRVTHATAVETMLILLEQQPPRPNDRTNSLRTLFAAGPPGFLERVEARFDLLCLQPYGMTEYGVVSSTRVDLDPAQTISERRLYPAANYVGYQVGTQTEIRVIDSEGADVAPGAPGEIIVRSPGMMLCYYENPEATDEAVRDGWLHTGDVGIMLASGALYFVERGKDIIRRAGENIAPKQVEEVLLSHPSVAQAAVVGVADEIRIQEVKAFVVLKEGAALSEADLWAWCFERLADYKVPRYLELMAELPTTASGKVQKVQLRSRSTVADGQRVFDRSASGARAGR